VCELFGECLFGVGDGLWLVFGVFVFFGGLMLYDFGEGCEGLGVVGVFV